MKYEYKITKTAPEICECETKSAGDALVVPRQEIKAVVRFTEHLRAPELSNPSDCAAHSITALTS